MPKLLQSKAELTGELLRALGRPVSVGGRLLPPITPGALSLLDAFGSPLIHTTGKTEPAMDELIASLLVWTVGPAAVHWRGYIPLLTLARHAWRVRRWKQRSAIALWDEAHRHIQESLAPLALVHTGGPVKKIDVIPEGTPRFGVDWLRAITAATLRAGFSQTFHAAAWHTPLVLACHAWASVAQRNGCTLSRPLDAAHTRDYLAKYETDHAAELAATRAQLQEFARHG